MDPYEGDAMGVGLDGEDYSEDSEDYSDEDSDEFSSERGKGGLPASQAGVQPPVLCTGFVSRALTAPQRGPSVLSAISRETAGDDESDLEAAGEVRRPTPEIRELPVSAVQCAFLMWVRLLR